MKKSSNPLEIVGKAQADNKEWWENHAMTYEGWNVKSKIAFLEDEVDYYKEIDE